MMIRRSVFVYCPPTVPSLLSPCRIYAKPGISHIFIFCGVTVQQNSWLWFILTINGHIQCSCIPLVVIIMPVKVRGQLFHGINGGVSDYKSLFSHPTGSLLFFCRWLESCPDQHPSRLVHRVVCACPIPPLTFLFGTFLHWLRKAWNTILGIVREVPIHARLPCLIELLFTHIESGHCWNPIVVR